MKAIVKRLHTAPNLRSLIYIIGVFIVLISAPGTILAVEENSLVIILKAIDYGEIKRIEYVPRPPYKAKTLICSEVAKELLLKAIYGMELDEAKLGLIMACKHDGYFSQTPTSINLDPEATLYATWLLKVIDAKLKANASLLLQELAKADTFDKAYYIAMTLGLLGCNVSKSMLKDFDLG